MSGPPMSPHLLRMSCQCSRRGNDTMTKTYGTGPRRLRRAAKASRPMIGPGAVRWRSARRLPPHAGRRPVYLGDMKTSTEIPAPKVDRPRRGVPPSRLVQLGRPVRRADRARGGAHGSGAGAGRGGRRDRVPLGRPDPALPAPLLPAGRARGPDAAPRAHDRCRGVPRPRAGGPARAGGAGLALRARARGDRLRRRHRHGGLQRGRTRPRSRAGASRGARRGEWPPRARAQRGLRGRPRGGGRARFLGPAARSPSCSPPPCPRSPCSSSPAWPSRRAPRCRRGTSCAISRRARPSPGRTASCAPCSSPRWCGTAPGSSSRRRTCPTPCNGLGLDASGIGTTLACYGGGMLAGAMLAPRIMRGLSSAPPSARGPWSRWRRPRPWSRPSGCRPRSSPARPSSSSGGAAPLDHQPDHAAPDGDAGRPARPRLRPDHDGLHRSAARRRGARRRHRRACGLECAIVVSALGFLIQALVILGSPLRRRREVSGAEIAPSRA